MEIWKKMWVGVFFWAQCRCLKIKNDVSRLIVTMWPVTNQTIAPIDPFPTLTCYLLHVMQSKFLCNLFSTMQLCTAAWWKINCTKISTAVHVIHNTSCAIQRCGCLLESAWQRPVHHGVQCTGEWRCSRRTTSYQHKHMHAASCGKIAGCIAGDQKGPKRARYGEGRTPSTWASKSLWSGVLTGVKDHIGRALSNSAMSEAGSLK